MPKLDLAKVDFNTNVYPNHWRERPCPNPTQSAVHYAMTILRDAFYGDAWAAGWEHDLHTGEPIKRNIGEMLMLTVSELSEAMEGHRSNLMDDKLAHRKMIEVELVDAVVRIFNIAGTLDLQMADAAIEKRAVNGFRPDHSREARLAASGKKY